MSADVASDRKVEPRTRAADWFVRLQSGEAIGDDWRAFETWLRETEGAQAAFEAVEAVWVDLDELKPALFPVQSPLRAARRPRFWVASSLAAGLACLAIGTVFLLSFGPHPSATSAPGGTRDLMLGDRGTIRPLGDTRVALARHGPGWLAHLHKGEVVVSVHHDPARPIKFVVAGESIIDVGTVFTVRQDERGLRVAVIEGEVKVFDRQPGWNALRVEAGKVLVRPPGRTGARLLAPDGSPFSLSYENTPLRAVVADLNRFYSRPVSIAGQLGDLRFSGVLRLDDQEATVGRLAAFTDLEVSHAAAGVQLHRPRSPSA